MSLLPHAWFSIGGPLWGDDGTYEYVPGALLPPLPPRDGSFTWLPPLDPRLANDRMTVADAATLPERLAVITEDARAQGLTVPPALGRFLSSDLPARIPSATACYFSLGTRLVPVPDHDGPERLLRFMNDQQQVVLWYLLLAPDGGHQVAFALPRWPDEEDEDYVEPPEDATPDDVAVPTKLHVCGASLEEFLERFWLENVIWYAQTYGYPSLDGELRAYVDAVARALASRAT